RAQNGKSHRHRWVGTYNERLTVSKACVQLPRLKRQKNKREECMGLWNSSGLIAAIGLSATVAFGTVATAQTKTLKVQASWPASATVYENLTQFAARVDRLTDGRVKIESMPAGQI